MHQPPLCLWKIEHHKFYLLNWLRIVSVSVSNLMYILTVLAYIAKKLKMQRKRMTSFSKINQNNVIKTIKNYFKIKETLFVRYEDSTKNVLILFRSNYFWLINWFTKVMVNQSYIIHYTYHIIHKKAPYYRKHQNQTLIPTI